MRLLSLTLALLIPFPLLAEGFVAARTLPVGTVISALDLHPQHGETAKQAKNLGLIGMQARVTIYEGRPVKQNLLRAPVLINRNQIVRMTFQRGALRISTEGRSLDQGAAGDLIRVMNLDSRSTVTARVEADGSLSITN